MITLDERKSLITISINETEPVEWRERLIKALAAATRWYALLNEGETYADKHSLAELATFQAELAIWEYEPETKVRKDWDERRKGK